MSKEIPQQQQEKSFNTKVLEKLVLGTPRSHPIDYEKVAGEVVTDPELWYLVIGTHKGHLAGFPAMQEVLNLQRIQNTLNVPPQSCIKGSFLLVASNIASGQNDTVTKYHEVVQPILSDLNVTELDILRAEDEKNMVPDEVRKFKMRQTRTLLGAIEHGFVPISFPEGTVESGRQLVGGKPGEIKGMMPLKEGSLKYLTKAIRLKGKEPVIFFVGNTGENRIYDPIHERITTIAKIKGVGMHVLRRNSLGESIMSSIVDYPTKLKDIEEAIGVNGKLRDGDLEQYCGERLAQLVPPHERGFYADPRLLDGNPQIRRRILHYSPRK